MGTSATQVRLLGLTMRDHDIKTKLLQLSNQKTSLARDMLKVSRKYQDALNTKALKWTNNAGVDYVNISYAGLMRPSAANNYSLYMLTDLSGRVVVDNKYKELAALISPDGSPGGDWESNRDQIMSQVLSISAEEIARGYEQKRIFDEESAIVEELEDHKPDPNSSNYSFVKNDTNALLKKLGTVGGINMDGFASSTTEITYDKAKEIITELESKLKRYFPDDQAAYDNAFKALNGIADTKKYSGKDLIDMLMQGLPAHMDSHGNFQISWYDVGDEGGSVNPSYQQYLDDKAAWKSDCDAHKEARDEAKTKFDEIFSPDVRSQLDFYEKLFTAIAEKGWKEYPGVVNDNYLNQMLQNNMFTITSVQRDFVQGQSGLGNDYSYENTYATDMPLNCTHIVQVNDSDIRDRALVEYEHEKRIINMKETKIDQRMKNLEAELEAIKNMMESNEKIKEENIDNTFNIFG